MRHSATLPTASTPCDDEGVWLPRKLLTRVLRCIRVPHSTFFRLSGSVRTFLTFTLAASTGLTCLAQTNTARPHAGASIQKRYCQQGGGFCFSYPANWTMLGESVGDGVVVAPQQALDHTLWDEVTVAAVVPAPSEDHPAMSIDKVIETAMANMQASGHNPATLQRQVRTVAGLPAQMIRIRYHDEPSGRDWIEQLVFIAGPEQEIYSVALKAQPGTIARLQAAFDNIVRSWKLQPADSSGGSQPSQVSPSKPSPPPTSPHP